MPKTPQQNESRKTKHFIKTVKKWIEIFKKLSPEKRQYVIGLFSGIVMAEADPKVNEIFAEIRNLFQELAEQSKPEVLNGRTI